MPLKIQSPSGPIFACRGGHFSEPEVDVLRHRAARYDDCHTPPPIKDSLRPAMRIVLCYPVEKRHYEQIAAAMPGAEVVDAGQQLVATEIQRADIFCGHVKVPLNWDSVVQAGRLKWIQSSAAGLDHCLVPAVVDSEITVTS